MENQDNLTPEQVAEIEALPLHEALGKVLGREFPDIQSAAKAAKDTFKFVGESGEGRKVLQAVMEKKGFKAPKEAVDYVTGLLETPAPAPVAPVVEKKTEIDPSQFVPRSEFDKDKFYSTNAELKPFEALVETFLRANPDKTRTDIIQMDEFKSAIGPIQAAKQKSIMHSDPKIGMAADTMEQAREKAASGNPISIREAEKLATKSVIDAFGV